MATQLEMIQKVLREEKVDGVMVGSDDYWGYTAAPKERCNVLIPWHEAQAYMGMEVDEGYGGVEGIWFTIWTPTRVLFWGCYDGSQWVEAVPRNPKDATKCVEPVGG